MSKATSTMDLTIDSADARSAFWKQKWSVPGTPWTICGYSRAAFRTGFYISELDTMLDVGPQNFSQPSNIFITHTHGDHIASLPFTMIRDNIDDTASMGKPIHIHAPAEAEMFLRRYISALFEVNSLIRKEGIVCCASCNTRISAGSSATFENSTEEDVDKNEAEESEKEYYQYHGYHEATTFRTVLNKCPMQIEVVLCDHSIPTISYGFSEVKQKLRPEYLGLPGKDIAKLRKDGVQITQEVLKPSLAFVCDTSIAVLTSYPSLLTYPILFIECTFLLPEELENAVATKHIHWQQLKIFVKANPAVLFVLMHFSLRYKDREILEFFDKEMECTGIRNIKVWAGETA